MLVCSSAAVKPAVATAAVVEAPKSPSPVTPNVTTNGAASSVGASPLERLDNLIKGSNQTAEASVHSKAAMANAGCTTIKGEFLVFISRTDETQAAPTV